MVLPRARRRSAAAPSTSSLTRPRPSTWSGGVDGSEEVRLADGDTVIVDHVIVTSGHTANQQASRNGSRPRQLSPYPVAPLRRQAARPIRRSRSRAWDWWRVDVAMALTVGRGGQFVENGDGAALPAERPRAGHSACSPAAACRSPPSRSPGVDRTDVYKPMICTPAGLRCAERPQQRPPAAGRRAHRAAAAAVRARCTSRYYAQVAFQRGTIADAGARPRAAPRRLERGALRPGGRSARADRYGKLRCRGACSSATSRAIDRSDDYEQFVYETLRRRPARGRGPRRRQPGEVGRRGASGSSAIRCATVVEQGGLSLDSYLDFNADICSRIHRLVAGPPALRSRQFLALMDAGVLRMPYGPGPDAGPGWQARTTGRDGAHADLVDRVRRSRYASDADVVIRGHLEEPADRRLGLAAAHAALQPRPRQPVPLRRGDGRQRRPDARLASDRHRRPAAVAASGCSGC